MKQLNLSEQQLHDLNDLYGRNIELVRLTMGTANNAAWAACLDAIDQIRKHPRYRQQIKGGSTPQKQFKRAFDMLKDYQRTLIYSEYNNCFRLRDLKPEYRKCFPDNFTDAEYYDFWSSFGFKAYEDTKPFFTSLVNKVRLAYTNHLIPYPDIMAWASAAQLALDLASEIWKGTMGVCDSIQKEYTHANISLTRWQETFADFNLRKVADFWKSCTRDLEPKIDIRFSKTENDNISDGYYQLYHKWTSLDTLFGSRIKSVEDYADIFRTHGEMKKLIREYAERKAEAENA